MEGLREKIRRMIRAGVFLGFIIITSSLTYWWADHGEHTLLDCFFMSIITVSTVGYGEAIPVDTPVMQGITMFLILTGTGGMLYFASLVTALIIEGDIHHWISRRSMERRIADLRDHFIVCGIGATGKHTVKELVLSGRNVVMLDASEAKLDAMRAEVGQDVCGVVGDAESDDVLRACGIERARGIVCALPSDRDNLFLVVTARKLAPSIQIVSRVILESAAIKLLRAGADDVISPNQIGGRRLAYQLLRPEASSFFELMMGEEERVMRIDEIAVTANSVYDGAPLGRTDLRSRYGLLVVAVRDTATGAHHYAPGPDFVPRSHHLIFAFGEAQRLAELRASLGGGKSLDAPS